MKKPIQTCSVVMTLLLIIVFAATSHAQLNQANSDVPYKSITPQIESTIERTAIIALRHISQARSDIHRKALASARRELAEAARLMESIRDNLSTSTAKNLISISRKHLEYEQPQQVLHELPAIYASLETISVYLPTDKAKRRLDLAKGYLEKNDKRRADRELALADKSLIVIEVELPLLNTQQYVTKAQEHLAARNFTKADNNLRIAEKQALALYTGMNSPLFQAKQNVWLAFQNYSTARHAEAGKHLKQARNYLSRVEAEGSAKVKEEAGKLSQEIEELEKKLAGEGNIAESAFKSAWEKSKALAERSAAYLSAGLSEAETTLGEKSNLIEARLHVAYAETYQVTTNEPDKAAKELDKALNYLHKAARSTLADTADRKKIHRIENILKALKENPEKNDAAVQERYETLKEGLIDLKVKEELDDLSQHL